MLNGMDPDPDPLDVLAARPEYRAWRFGRPRGKDYVDAWLPGPKPPLVIRDKTAAGLRARVDEFERVHKHHSLADALAAAEALDTSHLEG